MSEVYGHVILFDGVCNLCNRMVNFTINRDPHGKFVFASLQSKEGQALLQKFKLPEKDLKTMIYIRGEKIYLRSSAGLRILYEIGGFWKLAYAFMIIPKPVRDFFYRLIADSRYQLMGKRTNCMVPGPDIRNRFL